MRASRNRHIPTVSARLLLLLLLARAGVSQAAPIVFLDPGHGGIETGAVGAGGLAEKQVTLSIAQRVKRISRNRFDARLTRTADIRIPVAKRAEIANTKRARLFISLHAGSGFQQTPAPIRIFHPEPSPGAGETRSWDHLQNRHVMESRDLARLVAEALRDADLPRAVEVRPGPLAPLAPLDMPAILVEIGNLASPEDELLLSGNRTTGRIATGIADGIDDFLRRLPDAASTRQEGM